MSGGSRKASSVARALERAQLSSAHPRQPMQADGDDSQCPSPEPEQPASDGQNRDDDDWQEGQNVEVRNDIRRIDVHEALLKVWIYYMLYS